MGIKARARHWQAAPRAASVVFGDPQPRSYSEMQNDPIGFVARKHEGEAHAKTWPPDDCVTTQTGCFRG